MVQFLQNKKAEKPLKYQTVAKNQDFSEYSQPLFLISP